MLWRALFIAHGYLQSPVLFRLMERRTVVPALMDAAQVNDDFPTAPAPLQLREIVSGFPLPFPTFRTGLQDEQWLPLPQLCNRSWRLTGTPTTALFFPPWLYEIEPASPAPLPTRVPLIFVDQ